MSVSYALERSIDKVYMTALYGRVAIAPPSYHLVTRVCHADAWMVKGDGLYGVRRARRTPKGLA